MAYTTSGKPCIILGIDKTIPRLHQIQTNFHIHTGPIVLLISALLTAGYLLPVTMKGFLPGKDPRYQQGTPGDEEPPGFMLVPMAILAALTFIFGIFPNPLTKYIVQLVSGLM